mmetsp:Transcript_4113/g.9755  ORF Transcript_4113/g.9755 Transcript_4113/m.9755 type:complete len:211 (-) Transcript_4113:707-1339(-)
MPWTSWTGSARIALASASAQFDGHIHCESIRNARNSRFSDAVMSFCRISATGSSEPPLALLSASNTPCSVGCCTYARTTSGVALSAPLGTRSKCRMRAPSLWSVRPTPMPKVVAPSMTRDCCSLSLHSDPSSVGTNGHPPRPTATAFFPTKYFHSRRIHSSVGCPFFPAVHITSSSPFHSCGRMLAMRTQSVAEVSGSRFVCAAIASQRT